ncbi:MAG TPA: trehalase family glycosidase [Acidisarcina sp.]|nr:trehalase family glycosidase [Acidisarcina sp.]
MTTERKFNVTLRLARRLSPRFLTGEARAVAGVGTRSIFGRHSSLTKMLGVMLVLSCMPPVLFGAALPKAYERTEYLQTKKRLAKGWGTWDSRNILSQVLLPEGISVQIGFKQTTWIGNEYLDTALIGRTTPNAERIRPGLHALDGSYSEFELHWRDVDARIETAADGGELVMLVSPLKRPAHPVTAVVQIGMLWNRAGLLSRSERSLQGELSTRNVEFYVTGTEVEDPCVPSRTPYIAVLLNAPIGVSTSKPRSVEEMQRLIAHKRHEVESRAAFSGSLAETYLAVESGLAWNTIYEPKYDRVVSTVGRLWNEEYGGFCLFGWDNFFLSYMASLYSRDLAYANFLEHLRSMTDDGFIPNDDRGNGTKSWDHSQPPVGALMLKEIYKRYPERWLLEASFDDLLRWNRWWFKDRFNGGLLSYGSSVAQNPYGDPDAHSAITAGYESGMDDSPMYEGVPFNASRGVLELQDVGLNSLYVADCEALEEIATLLGRKEEAEELNARGVKVSTAMASLWDAKSSLYLNRRTDTGELSHRLSPTMFYPLLAGIPDKDKARRMIQDHYMNPAEFYGEFMLPSAARNDPSFPAQRYWKGAVWPPLNFLVYLGLREYGFEKERKALAESSREMFLQQWRKDGLICENYSSISGSGEDPRLSSDRFHSWGALMGFLSVIEAGLTPPTEAPIRAR